MLDKKLISTWDRRTLPLKQRHRCTSSLPNSCLWHYVLASRLLMKHASAEVIVQFWKIWHLIYLA